MFSVSENCKFLAEENKKMNNIIKNLEEGQASRDEKIQELEK